MHIQTISGLLRSGNCSFSGTVEEGMEQKQSPCAAMEMEDFIRSQKPLTAHLITGSQQLCALQGLHKEATYKEKKLSFILLLRNTQRMDGL
ncbi:uncharacterized protein LOC114678859 [Macaca mulatta]